MLVYKCEGQDIEDMDVLKVEWEFYIVHYNMLVAWFILYPLGWHGLEIKYLESLPLSEWEYLGNIWDKWVYEQIPIVWPSSEKVNNIKEYLCHITL